MDRIATVRIVRAKLIIATLLLAITHTHIFPSQVHYSQLLIRHVQRNISYTLVTYYNIACVSRYAYVRLLPFN